MNPGKILTMKKLFTIIMLLYGLNGFAQPFNNEWVDPAKTYYKFKTNRTGLFRIPQTTLAGLGLVATPAEQFKMWRNGKEVALYTTVPSGALPANGYIEFWSDANDGKPDLPLYRDPKFQHTDKLSLQTDTVVYFLTVDPVAANLRMTDVNNDVAGNVLPVEPYFMYTSGRYFSEKMNPGFAAVVGTQVFSSSYDQGEYFSTANILPGSPRLDSKTSLFPFAGGPAAQLKFGASGAALNTRSIQVAINGTQVQDTVCDYFNDIITSSSFPVSFINTGSSDVQFSNTSSTPTDRMVISFYELTYPRQFNFGGANNFYFELPAKGSGYFLQITNFNYGSIAPVLFDLTYHQRITGDISTPGTVKFAIAGASADRQLILVSEDPASPVNIASTDFTQKNFIDFNNTANQGDYLIISNKLLYNGTGGVNPVDEYKKYRNTADGGSFNAKVIDIDELVDQFAFGIKKHPLSVKNFLRFARSKFAVSPQYALLIGRGIAYTEYHANLTDPMDDRLNLIPTFGWPASDNMLSSADGASSIAITPIGRISAVSPQEVSDYLEKVKEYEHAQKYNLNTIEDRAWMKNVMQVTGASDSYLGTVLCSYMDDYSKIISDTLTGASVTTFCKNSTDPVEQLSNDRIAKLFEDGLSMVTYFGHSSSTVLEFNIDNPEAYNNPGKYPFFSVNGCNAGNFFTFDPQRFSYNQTLSEKFTFAKQRGGIGFLASTHFGIVNYLNIFITNMYDLMARTDYGTTLGKLNRDAGQRLVQIAGNGDFYARFHAEEMTLNGDPALKVNFQPLPDYVIEDPQVVINPQFISIAEDKFNVSIKMYNIGKAVSDSITVEVKQQYPDNTQSILLRKKIRGIRFIDSLNFEVPIVATRDKGQNKLIIKLDADNVVNEVSETNNIISKDFFIYEDEARPTYPYNYSIVTQQNIKLYASTANPFSSLKQYVLEMDTTENFNSPQKITKTLSSVGGLLEFDPGMTFQDSTVYYWRTSFVPGTGGQYRWSNSSFIYLASSSAGFNQSHYFQHLGSTLDRMSIGADRKWKFGERINNLFARNTMYPTGGREDAEFSVNVNGQTLFVSACLGHSLLFNVLDPVTFKPWKNVDGNNNNLNLYGSANANCAAGREYNFEFSYMTPASRKMIADFMDTIPTGAYVVVRSFDYNANNSYSATWKSDEAIYGTGNTIYHRLLQAGLTNIDSINAPRSWAMIYKKGDTSFASLYKISDGIYDRVVVTEDCPTPDTLGYITSPQFGPAKNWKQVHWRGSSLEPNSSDDPSVQVIGVTNTGTESVLFNLDKTQQDFDITTVNALQYPFIKLKMRNVDSVDLTPYQLRYWRLDYDPLPEGALIPNIYFRTKDPTKTIDSLDIGEKLNFGIAFKNISAAAFDSIKIKMYILDRNNVPHTIQLPRRKPLIAGDSIRLDYEIDTKDLPGMNILYIDFNPDNDQPEQYHFNNFMFRNFYVKPDKTNPLLDVTFDNVHILNRDIVSAKPHIQIKLKDEAKYLLLTDTAGTTVQVRFPDANNTLKTYQFGGDTLKFTPATSGQDNTATIDFYPQFLNQINPDGDEYELIIKGKDISGNKAGTSEYKVTFRIISKPMISNLLNYPNPFTTSTAFVFTVTGSEVPENMKIQILTVTGKIVREITKQELGPLHIGRNITDYKWDGNDQFGQRLANGVYLYRFVTTLNGKKMDKYSGDGDNTDKFFTRGYGKMYLMR
jgi:Peptidase family C25/CARDB